MTKCLKENMISAEFRVDSQEEFFFSKVFPSPTTGAIFVGSRFYDQVSQGKMIFAQSWVNFWKNFFFSNSFSKSLRGVYVTLIAIAS